MPTKDLVFRLFGEDVNASSSMRRLSRSAEESSKGIHRAFGDAPRDVTAIAAAAGAASVFMAAKFQTATTRLVTDAGESEKNLGRVQTGIERISNATGLSSEEIARGMYLVESAGYHGAAGLKVMSAAAEGAKIGGADVRTVADALTTAMTDYHVPASKAADTTSKLIATVSAGKTTMEDLAGSLHSVLPGAESAGIGMNQVLGAMATMTAEGISADQAAENLNHAILSLQNPSQVQTKAMAAMGLSAFDVAKNLGKKGLTGTYEELTHAIAAHIKDGAVVQQTFNTSKQAAASANTELKAMPASIRGIAQAYLNGTITQKQWTTEIKAQTPLHANLLKQFGATASAAHGFSDAVKSGQGPFATYNAQMAKMTGGQTGLQVALHLTGSHMATFEKNSRDIGHATTEAGGHVRDWKVIQATFNQQLAEAGQQLANTGIQLGTRLLPALTAGARAFSGFMTDLHAGKPAAVAVAAAVGIFVGTMVALYTATKIMAAASTAAKIGLLAWSAATKVAAAAQWLFNAAMDANPVGLVILAIAALIAIIVLVVTHWKQICGFIQNVWGAVCAWWADTIKNIGSVVSTVFHAIGEFISRIVSGVVGFVKAHWQLLLAIFLGPLGLVIDFIVTNFATIRRVVETVIGFVLRVITTDINAVKAVITTVVGWISDFWSTEVRGWQAIITAVWGFIRPYVTAAITGVRAVISSVVGTISSVWHSAWGAISSFFGGIWKAMVGAVSTGISTVLNFFRPLGSRVISAIGNAATLLVDSGRNLIQGLINGATGMVSSLLGTIGGIAKKAIDTARSVFGIHSPSRVFQQIGVFIGEGLVLGLHGSAAKVHQATAHLANLVVTAFNHLADKRAAAQKRLHLLDERYHNALADAPRLVANSEGKITAARRASYEHAVKIHKQRLHMLREERDAERANLREITHAQGKGVHTALTHLVKADTTKLEALAKRRDGLTERLKAAKGQLKDALKAWQDDHDSASGDVVGLGSVMSTYTAVAQQHADAVAQVADLKDQLAKLDPSSDSYGADQAGLQGKLAAQQSLADSTGNSTGAMAANLQQRIADTRRFQADLQQLVKAGIDPTTYQQLVQGGIGGGGLQAADQLLASGAGSVAQMASLQAQLKAAGDGLGTDVANHLDGAGVQAAQGLVNGLDSQLVHVTKSMEKIADAMVAAIRRKLDIHSPSRVFEWHGKQVPAGLVKGIDSGRKDAERSVAGLVNVARPVATAPGSVGLPGQIPGAGRTAPLVHIDNFHATPEQSPADIAADLGWLTRGGF